MKKALAGLVLGVTALFALVIAVVAWPLAVGLLLIALILGLTHLVLWAWDELL